MATVDLSMPVTSEILLYPGQLRPTLKFESRMENGEPYTVSRIEMGSHTGTHVDAPIHFLPGTQGIDEMPVDRLCGPCDVLDLTGLPTENIGREHLVRQRISADIVLLKTRNSQFLEDGTFRVEACSLALDGAEYLVEQGVKAVGIDYLSIESADTQDFPVHKRLLSVPVYVIEGLALARAPVGRHELICLPIRVVGADAAPARAFLRV